MTKDLAILAAVVTFIVSVFVIISLYRHPIAIPLSEALKDPAIAVQIREIVKGAP